MKRKALIVALLLGVGGVLIGQTARHLARPLARPIVSTLVTDEGTAAAGPVNAYLQPGGVDYYLQPGGTEYYLQP